MGNNTPDYEDNLAFDPDVNNMPRCDIEDLKKQLETANFYRDQSAEYIQRLEEENARLKNLLRECKPLLCNIGQWSIKRQGILKKINEVENEERDF